VGASRRLPWLAAIATIATACIETASPDEQPGDSSRVLWRVFVESQGAVAQDDERVYFAGRRQHAGTARFKRDGKTAWHSVHRFGQAFTVGGPGVVLAGPVAVFSDSLLYAYDRVTGERRWTFDAGQGEIGGSYVDVDESTLTIYSGSPEGTVYAIDAITGEERWSSTPDLGVQTGAYSPVHDGGQVFVGFDGGLASLDAATGALQWQVPFAPFLDSLGGSPRSLGSVIVDGSIVYAGIERGLVVALDRSTGELRWRRVLADAPESFGGRPQIAMAGGRIVVRMLRGELYGLDPQSGEVVWIQPASEDFAFERMTTDSRVVYFTELNGFLVAVDGATGEKLLGDGIRMLGGLFGGVPAVDDRAIYVGGSITAALRK
jgi:outer membrane protein assembly factor BamB